MIKFTQKSIVLFSCGLALTLGFTSGLAWGAQGSQEALDEKEQALSELLDKGKLAYLGFEYTVVYDKEDLAAIERLLEGCSSEELLDLDKTIDLLRHSTSCSALHPMLPMLLEKGLDPARPIYLGRNSLMGIMPSTIEYAELKEICSLLGMLMNTGADPNLADEQGNTALHLAAAAGYATEELRYGVLKYLIESGGAKITASNHNGERPCAHLNEHASEACRALLCSEETSSSATAQQGEGPLRRWSPWLVGIGLLLFVLGGSLGIGYLIKDQDLDELPDQEPVWREPALG